MVEAAASTRFALDFAYDRFGFDRRLRIGVVGDDFTQKYVAEMPAASIFQQRVGRALTAMIARRVKAGMTLSKNRFKRALEQKRD